MPPAGGPMPPTRPRPARATLALLLAVATLLLAPAAGQILPGPVLVTFEGVGYSVVTVNCTQLYDCDAAMRTSAAWGNQSLASGLAGAVGGSLGWADMSGTNTGPVFPYNDPSAVYEVCARLINTSTTSCTTESMSLDWPVAIATSVPASPSPSPSPEASPSPSPSPEASPSPSLSPEASPSPSPSPGQLDCSSATFNLPILSSRLNSQICTASKAIRTGKPTKLVTNVTLSLPGASINITDIVTNKATAGWQCRCRPTTHDNCTCLPNAVLLGGGSFLVMPQWRRNTLPGRVVDTTLQVSFTASSNGGTCTGTAVICSAWGVRANRPPPVCAPFNSTGVTRPALTCV